MLSTMHELLDLTAADLMSREVIVIPERMSLRGAAHLLRRARISGAPVIDTEGHCSGVLSSTDFVRWVEDVDRPALCLGGSAHGLHSDWEVLDPEEVPTDEVRNYMTRDPVTVDTSLGIGELAQRMLDAHIHRVIVVDPVGRPVGIVSSTDILAAVARVARGRPC
jgi:CBS-domain-containing membrane protein